MIKYVIKRDGRRAKFNPTKISDAITSAFLDKEMQVSKKELEALTDKVCDKIETSTDKPTVSVETIQDVVEDVLMSKDKYKEVAKAYILYRAERTRKRESKSKIISTIQEIKAADLKNSNILRDNANESGCTPAGAYGKIASETNKTYNLLNVVDRNIAELHSKGYMHIHDLNLYDLTFNCLFAPIGKLLKTGFDSGTGFIRSPKSIQSAASITAVILQLQSNQQFGGIASANLDFELAPYVDMSFKKNLAWIIASNKVLSEKSLEFESFDDIDDAAIDKAIKKEAHAIRKQMAQDGLSLNLPFKDVVAKYDRKAVVEAYIKTKDDTYQAMEGLVHNLNSLQSRSGNQVPFSSLNFGLDTSRCGRLVSSNLIAAQMAGLGDGLTAIFPILIIKYMKGVSYLPEDPNYDLKKAGIACLARRFYPNAVGVDNDFNAPYIRYEYNDEFKLTDDTLVKKIGGDRVAKYGEVASENDVYPRWEVLVDGKYWQICMGRLQRIIPESTVSTMGCRTRVLGNVNGPEQTIGRGNLAFHTLNLPKLAVEAHIEATNEADRIKLFNEKLDRMLVLAKKSLEDRFQVIAKKTYENFPFTMQQGLYLTSDDKVHDIHDTIEEVLRQGTLSIGYIGVYEAVLALTGKTWGKDEDVFDIGFNMVKRIRDFCDKTQKETHMNWSCFATPAEPSAEILVLGQEVVLLVLAHTRVDDDVLLVVDDGLELLGGNAEQGADLVRSALEVPDVSHRNGQGYVAHTLAAYLLLGDFDTAAVADDSAVADPLVLAAVALVILGRTEDLLAEETVTLGLVGPVVDRFRLQDLAAGPFGDVLRRGEGDGNLREVRLHLAFLVVICRPPRSAPPSPAATRTPSPPPSAKALRRG